MSLKIAAAFNPPIGADEYQLIGMLSVLWSQVEFCVEAAIYSVQGLDFVEGRQTELPRDLSRKADKLKALVGNYCRGSERRSFIHLCDRVSAAAPLRNLAVHGNWARLTDRGNAIAAVSWFKVPVGEQIQMLFPEQLPGVASEVGAISLGFYELLPPRGAFRLLMP